MLAITPGDYQQYMDYSKYTQGQGSQGGASDYKKYMESYSGDYRLTGMRLHMA